MKGFVAGNLCFLGAALCCYPQRKGEALGLPGSPLPSLHYQHPAGSGML